MKNPIQIFVFILIISVWSCSTKPEPILYGKENCSFCKMTIMDSKYGCELVSKKGKIFKFDDLSCMIKYMKINEETSTDFAHIVVNQFDNPGEFIETSKAFFLKSPKYQSPMMGNIASFTNLEKVDKAIGNDTLAIEYTWDELLNTLK